MTRIGFRKRRRSADEDDDARTVPVEGRDALAPGGHEQAPYRSVFARPGKRTVGNQRSRRWRRMPATPGLEADSIDYRGMPDPAGAGRRNWLRGCAIQTMRSCWSAAAWAGYVAVAAAQQRPAAGLFLMAPALAVPGLGRNWKKPSPPQRSLCTAGRTTSCRSSGASTSPAPTTRGFIY